MTGANIEIENNDLQNKQILNNARNKFVVQNCKGLSSSACDKAYSQYIASGVPTALAGLAAGFVVVATPEIVAYCMVNPLACSNLGIEATVVGAEIATNTPKPINVGSNVISGGKNAGKVIGSLDKLTTTEKQFVQELIDQGHTIAVIPTGTTRTADFLIDAVKYELKTVDKIVSMDPGKMSGSISSTIMNARGQSSNIIIDARNQEGMTMEIAARSVARAITRDKETGGKIKAIVIFTKDGTFRYP